MKKDDEDDAGASFPIDVKSSGINFLQKVILVGIKILALLMTLAIIRSILNVGYLFYLEVIETPTFSLNIDQLLGLFGAFLLVLIAIEIFLNIILYLRKDMSHLKLVLATALMAIARKIIILDYASAEAWVVFSMAAVIASLGLTYWLVVNSHTKMPKE